MKALEPIDGSMQPSGPEDIGERKPVLVTGSPRSGTTWVGRMLTQSPSLYYVYEPFNPNAGVGRDVCDAPFTRYYTYVAPSNERVYYPGVKDMIDGQYHWWRGIVEARSLRALRSVWAKRQEFAAHRAEGRMPLIKDPIAMVSAEWFARRFDINVVVMIRHPAAFVSSMKRLNWNFRPNNWALSQPELMNDFLESYRAELEELERNDGDIVDRTALMWKILNHMVLRFRDNHPQWTFLRHEDISLDPVGGFQRLYRRLGLEFTDDIRTTVERYSNESNASQSEGTANAIALNSKSNIDSWKRRLSSDEVRRIRDRVKDVAAHFYSDAEWSSLASIK